MPIELLQALLPHQTDLCLDDYQLDSLNHQVCLTVSTVQPAVACPLCQSSTHRVHSRYQRTLRDFRWADYTVILTLNVRKFFCLNLDCQRRIFTERLPTVVAPWARRTARLAQQLTSVALALGGAAGVRLARHLGYLLCRNSLLNLIAKLPLPQLSVSPQALGVDDFAFQKRHRYGTILVDLDQHKPIALLEGRDAGTLAQWLKQHPGAQILSRDRSKDYKLGMSQGAPDAIQVADRFHLLQNLAQVLEKVFAAHPHDLKAVEAALRPSGSQLLDDEQEVVTLPPLRSALPQQVAQQRRQQRIKTFQKVWNLHRQGLSAPTIARKVKLSTKTVQRFLASSQFPERQPRSDQGRSLIEPFKTYLLQRWNQGVFSVKQLFHEIHQQGYQGSYMTATRYVRQLAQAHGWNLRHRPRGRSFPPVTDPKQPPLTPRRAAWLLLRRPDDLHPKDQQLISLLSQHNPCFALTIQLSQNFTSLVRQQLSDQFDPWLNQAIQSDIPPLQRFAHSLRSDYQAVKAAVTLPFSNGQVEGQINRLKTLKRQMYGRAGTDLLAKRFLLAD